MGFLCVRDFTQKLHVIQPVNPISLQKSDKSLKVIRTNRGDSFLQSNKYVFTPDHSVVFSVEFL